MTTETNTQQTAATARADLPPQEICTEVLIEKYAKGKEQSIQEVRARVARALIEEWLGESLDQDDAWNGRIA